MTRPPTANGYTLIDMLAALMILGLAMVGLGQGMFALARLQGATTRSVESSTEVQNAHSALARLLNDPAATPERLSGDAGELNLGCAPATCRAALTHEDGVPGLIVRHGSHDAAVRLSGPAPARFSYVLDEGDADVWPIPNRRLVAVQILGADGRVLAYHRLWRQQPLDCAFDPVSRRCPTSP